VIAGPLGKDRDQYASQLTTGADPRMCEPGKSIGFAQEDLAVPADNIAEPRASGESPRRVW
jgi:hypothetical protein